MKKILLLLLLIPSVLAISMSIPEQREIIFEPFKEITVSYNVGNSGPATMLTGINVEPGKLENYITIPQKQISIPPFGQGSFSVQISLPETLTPGLYPLRITVAEQSQGGGMSALTGATDVINIISPYNEGYPYINVHVNQYQTPEQPISFLIEVQNIGKTDLKGIKPDIMIYQDGKRLKETTTTIQANLKPYEKQKFKNEINTAGLTPGYYDLIVKAGQTETKNIITLGQPTITVKNYPSFKADETNTFNATIKLENWASPMKNASVTFHITNLFSSYQEATLQPGENNLEFTAEAKPGKTGVYPGRVRINGNLVKATGEFQADVKGSTTTQKTRFAKTPEKQEEQEPEELEPTKTVEKIKETAKNEIFLILLLIASFAVFAFALGQYLARRRMNNAPPYQ